MIQNKSDVLLYLSSPADKHQLKIDLSFDKLCHGNNMVTNFYRKKLLFMIQAIDERWKNIIRELFYFRNGKKQIIKKVNF